MFLLSSEITIGKFRFTGVHSIVIKRSVHSIVETARITVPAIAATIKNGKASIERSSTASQFSVGDAVTIRLGYNGRLETEFVGFVKQLNLNMPLEIECEGYSYLLRNNKPTITTTKQDIKSLAEAAVADIANGQKISVICDESFELTNVAIDTPSGFDLLNYISKLTDNNISCFFIEPSTLWCGLLYTAATKGTLVNDTKKAQYRPGFNALKNHTLRTHNTEIAAGSVEYNRRNADGTKSSYVATTATNNKYKHALTLNNIKNEKGLKLLAEEKVLCNNYQGCEGIIEGLLQPYVAPGYKVYIQDNVSPAINGTYLAESTEVRFGVDGARRIVELGPKVNS